MTHPSDLAPLRSLIRTIPDFPEPGIQFRDITPLLADARGLTQALDALERSIEPASVDIVAAIEARGFLLAGALAQRLGAGVVPVRKPGKLPGPTLGVDYALEYGSDRLEIHEDAIGPARRVLLVDDVLATGGTLLAARSLLERAGAHLVGAAVLVELTALAGRARWGAGAPLEAALRY